MYRAGAADPFTFRQTINGVLSKSVGDQALEQPRLEVPLDDLAKMDDENLLNHNQQIYEEWQRMRTLAAMCESVSNDELVDMKLLFYVLNMGEQRMSVEGASWLRCMLPEIAYCRKLCEYLCARRRGFLRADVDTR